MRPDSLTGRLILAGLAWLAVVMALSGPILGFAFRDSVERAFERRLDALLRGMAAAVTVASDGTVGFSRPLGEPRFDQVFSGWYWQVSDGQALLLRSRSLWDAALPVAPGEDGVTQRRNLPGPSGQRLVALERDLAFAGVERPLHVLIAADRGEIDAEVRRFDLLVLAALGLLAAGLVAGIVVQVRFGLRPLRRLAKDLAALRRQPQARLGGAHPREIAPLVQALNAVLDHDAELIERARTHVGNLAHALKTPLSLLGAECRHAPPDAALLAAQVGVMTQLIEHHLARARAEAGSGRALGVRTPLAATAAGLRAALARVHADKGLVLELAVPAGLEFPGEREDLEEILGNLMDNACKWARRRVVVSAGRDGAGLWLAVEDDGPGLSPEQAAAASARGSRLDEASPGWGLGLAIVADLVALHGGRLGFERAGPGGLRVTVRLPDQGAPVP